MEKEKKPLALAIILIILLVAAAAFCGYLLGTTKNNNKVVEKEVTENENVSEKETAANQKEETKSPYRTCVGTYKGTGPVSIDLDHNTTKGEYTLSLKEDNTYEWSTGVAKGIGNYLVKDNTLILIHNKETYGPEDQDPVVATNTYVISKDCSKVLFTSVVNSEKVNLSKQ